eukprot:scaffold28824_cov67-Isochrysis_galbana.AAC.1
MIQKWNATAQLHASPAELIFSSIQPQITRPGGVCSAGNRAWRRRAVRAVNGCGRRAEGGKRVGGAAAQWRRRRARKKAVSLSINWREPEDVVVGGRG